MKLLGQSIRFAQARIQQIGEIFMSWETILFDLDGTLTDPAEGITKAVEVALNHYGITVEDRSTLNKFIGPASGRVLPGILWLQ